MTDTSRIQVLYPLYRKVIREGIAYLKDSPAPLELWVNFERWPNWREMFPNTPITDKGGVVGLGVVTRTKRLFLNDDHLLIITPEKTCIEIPYKAIYNVAILGAHTNIGWSIQRSTKREADITFFSFTE